MDECCDNCKHCFGLSLYDKRLFLKRLGSTYGNWHKHERDVNNAVSHVLGCIGWCEKLLGLTDLGDPPCGDYETEDDDE